MKANAYFSRFGVSFNCSTCGMPLKELPSGNLVHLARKGLFKRALSDCAFKGKMFVHPFMGIELKAAT